MAQQKSTVVLPTYKYKFLQVLSGVLFEDEKNASCSISEKG
jgi:hypothetical protein